jgi:hypothetical protein
MRLITDRGRNKTVQKAMSHQDVFDECYGILGDNVYYIENHFVGLELAINLYLTILGVRSVSLLETYFLDYTKDINDSNIGKYLNKIKMNPDYANFYRIKKMTFITTVNSNIIALASKHRCETVFLNENTKNIIVVKPKFKKWGELMTALDIESVDQSSNKAMILGSLLGYPLVEDFITQDHIVTLVAYFRDQNNKEKCCEIFSFKTDNHKEISNIENAKKIKTSLRNINFVGMHNILWTFTYLQSQLIRFDIDKKTLKTRNRIIIATMTY